MGAMKVGALAISPVTHDFSVTNKAHAAAMRLSSGVLATRRRRTHMVVGTKSCSM